MICGAEWFSSTITTSGPGSAARDAEEEADGVGATSSGADGRMDGVVALERPAVWAGCDSAHDAAAIRAKASARDRRVMAGLCRRGTPSMLGPACGVGHGRSTIATGR